MAPATTRSPIPYTPTRANPGGEYRNIHIELNGKSYKLAYRHGYYAEPANSAPPDSTSGKIRAIQLAARYTAPPSTEIRFFARLEPQPTGPTAIRTATHRELTPERFRHDQIDFSVDPAALSLITSADGRRHAHLEYLTLVYDAQGRIVDSNVQSVRATWTPAQFATALQQGVRYQQPIAVPATGVHSLRVLIHDLGNDKIGSIDLPASALQP